MPSPLDKFGEAEKQDEYKKRSTNSRSLFFTPTHVIKEVPSAHHAQREVAGAKFMRALGIHEAPDHQHVEHEGKHYVVSHRIHGDFLDKSEHFNSTPTQRHVDTIAAERFIGHGDRWGANYIVHPSGSVHPIDFGHVFLPGMPADSTQKDYGLHKHLSENVSAREISPQLRRRMIRLLPAVSKYMNKFRMDRHTPESVDTHQKTLESVLTHPSPQLGHFPHTGM